MVYDDSNTLFKESVVGYDESLKGTYQTVNININSENYTQLNVALVGVNGNVIMDDAPPLKHKKGCSWCCWLAATTKVRWG